MTVKYMYDIHRVDQTLFGQGVGNCFPACIATITGAQLAEIPNFSVLYPNGGDFFKPFQRWCVDHGLAPWYVSFGDDPDMGWVCNGFPFIPWIAGGKNHAGDDHCCVYIGGALWHDPNPRSRQASKAGLTKLEDGIFFLKSQYR